MDNYLADINGTTYGGILSAVESEQTTRVIETQLLDGTWNVQTIGSPSTKINVTYYGSIATRRTLEAARAAATPIKVYWKDRVYTGIISGEVGHERWSRNRAALAEKMTMQLLITAEVAR